MAEHMFEDAKSKKHFFARAASTASPRCFPAATGDSETLPRPPGGLLRHKPFERAGAINLIEQGSPLAHESAHALIAWSALSDRLEQQASR